MAKEVKKTQKKNVNKEENKKQPKNNYEKNKKVVIEEEVIEEKVSESNTKNESDNKITNKEEIKNEKKDTREYDYPKCKNPENGMCLVETDEFEVEDAICSGELVDNEDGNKKSNITVKSTGGLNVSKPVKGKYTVIYEVKDSDNNTSQKEIKVNVKQMFSENFH